eukprot:5092432-Pleurochrysis_carterae.AAC.1
MDKSTFTTDGSNRSSIRVAAYLSPPTLGASNCPLKHLAPFLTSAPSAPLPSDLEAHFLFR